MLIIWTDGNINPEHEDSQYTLKQLKAVSSNIVTFLNVNDCIQFVRSHSRQKLIVITSGSYGCELVRQIHPMQQVKWIYIFCRTPSLHKEWTRAWSKIKSVDDRIELICHSLKVVIAESHGLSTQTMDPFAPSFLCLPKFQELLLKMNQDEQQLKRLVTTWHEICHQNPKESALVKTFEKNYQWKSPLYWYREAPFLSQMLDQALRSFEPEAIFHFGFFLRDLCRDIEKQRVHNTKESLKVYYGEAVPTDDYDKLNKSEGYLISFNRFLRATRERAISLKHARDALNYPYTVGVLFVITVNLNDHSISPFVEIDGSQSSEKERNVLFSLDTIFRLDRIRSMEKNQPLFEVQLTAVPPKDLSVFVVKNRLEENLRSCSVWQQLNDLFTQIRPLDADVTSKVELSEQKTMDNKTSSSNHSSKNTDESYKVNCDPVANGSNIVQTYCHVIEYSKALSYHYSKALDID